MTFPLLSLGYSMIGVDASENMLAEARDTRRGDEILWLCQDMRSFELYGTVEGVVSTLDCVNHLLRREDVLSCFSLVHNYLVPNGIFIFDVNTPYKFKHIYGENSYVLESESAFCVWQNFFDERRGRCHFAVDLFEENEKGLYERRSADREVSGATSDTAPTTGSSERSTGASTSTFSVSLPPTASRSPETPRTERFVVDSPYTSLRTAAAPRSACFSCMASSNAL